MKSDIAVDRAEDVDAKVKTINEAKAVINSRRGKTHGFVTHAQDVFKYNPTPGCYGCRFVLGMTDSQSGHSTECRMRLMELMKEDMQDSEKVRRWQLAGGIVDESEDISRPEEHNQNSDVGAASSKTSGAKKTANRANPASEPQCSRCHKALTCEPNGLEASVSCATRLFMRTRVCTDVNTAVH